MQNVKQKWSGDGFGIWTCTHLSLRNIVQDPYSFLAVWGNMWSAILDRSICVWAYYSTISTFLHQKWLKKRLTSLNKFKKVVFFLRHTYFSIKVIDYHKVLYACWNWCIGVYVHAVYPRRRPQIKKVMCSLWNTYVSIEFIDFHRVV